jgi:hypothetical protein
VLFRDLLDVRVFTALVLKRFIWFNFIKLKIKYIKNAVSGLSIKYII